MKVALSSRSSNNIVWTPQISFSVRLPPFTLLWWYPYIWYCLCIKMSSSKPTNFLQREFFSNPFCKQIRKWKIFFGDCNDTLLIYGAPKFSTVYLLKWPVLGLQQAPENSILAPSVLVGPAFIPDYRVNLLYILDSNLPAKKLLLGIQYSTFIEQITKHIHTWSCKALWGPGLNCCQFLKNAMLFSLSF